MIWGRGRFETKVGTTLPMFGVEGYNILIRRVMNNGKIVESGETTFSCHVMKSSGFRDRRSETLEERRGEKSEERMYRYVI
jgi:hypothetical protein